MPAIDSRLLTTKLDEQLQQLIIAAPLMPLDETGFDSRTYQALQAWLERQPTISRAGVAGLWLLAGDLERSHEISQSIDTLDGSYWHGIMHRREGDYSNAKYWLRRTGGHSVTAQLKGWTHEYVDALSFVDYVERAVIEDHALRRHAEQIQWCEWQLLFQNSMNYAHK